MRTRKQTAWRATVVYLAIVAVGIAITAVEVSGSSPGPFDGIWGIAVTMPMSLVFMGSMEIWSVIFLAAAIQSVLLWLLVWSLAVEPK